MTNSTGITCGFDSKYFKKNDNEYFKQEKFSIQQQAYGGVDEEIAGIIFDDFKSTIDDFDGNNPIDPPKAIDSPKIIDLSKIIDSPKTIDLPKLIETFKADNSEMSSYYLALASAGVIGLTLCLYKIHSIVSNRWNKEESAPQTTQLKVDENKIAQVLQK